MSLSETQSERCARSRINTIRRSNFKIQALLLMIPAGLLVWMFYKGEMGQLLWLFGSIIAFIFVSAFIDRRDVCPMCRHKISTLPNEGHFRLPRLSKKIHACPFCSGDFDKIEEEGG